MTHPLTLPASLTSAALAIAVAAGLAVPAGQAQADGANAAIRRHVQTFEGAANGSLDDVLARLEREHFSRAFMDRTTPEDRRRVVTALREAAADVGGAQVEGRDDRIVLTLEGARTHHVIFTLESAPPFKVDSLEIRAVEGSPGDGGDDAPALSRENLESTFDRLEADGWSGVVHVRLGGDVVLERPFGQADADRPVALNTVFGTGSRPIDYTIAAIYLLAQQGRLTLDDPIARHLPGVPDDKRAMTIRHLLTGRSGLPDFFHTADDWDPDLAWIDRETAERRLLGQPLLFAPGEGRQHSHGAFGLAASIVQRVSGQSYEAFLRQHFFDPADMARTGSYGEARDLPPSAFAVGGGPSRVGVPNIPPNWGRTSWLIKGSGGMYSTLPDLLRFYSFVREGGVFEDQYANHFRSPFITVDGSDRGFELFHAYNPQGNEAILMVNMPGNRPDVRGMFRALARLVEDTGGG